MDLSAELVESLGRIGSAIAVSLAAVGSALGTGAAGMAAVGAWKKCYAQNKAAPFLLAVFVGAPITQTFYGLLAMFKLNGVAAACGNRERARPELAGARAYSPHETRLFRENLSPRGHQRRGKRTVRKCVPTVAAMHGRAFHPQRRPWGHDAAPAGRVANTVGFGMKRERDAPLRHLARRVLYRCGDPVLTLGHTVQGQTHRGHLHEFRDVG